ncbi:MAG: phosphoribosyltransferase domain-containing protein [Methylococcales bacterium]|nr:phosphoribosyltransferase domain-containing protein [Methylococcales bacterium]
MSFSKIISLPTGSLSIQINESETLFNQYIDFAARNNPKRGFLFVSKVLGKHYPCTPDTMQHSYSQLVDLLLVNEKDSQQFVFIGMAETATALGLGVYETWLKRSQKHGIYCQTTRYFLENQPFVDFEEAHSHATGFYLYHPKEHATQQVFNQADTLVLVDDEVSTGNTFANLVNAYKKINPALKRVIIVSLLNLTSANARKKVAQKTGMVFEWLSILSGQFTFTPNPDYEFKTIHVDSNQQCKKYLLNGNYGRLGIDRALPELTGQITPLIADLTSKNKVLVLGTGEFIYHAYLVAKEFERAGIDAYVQSTTRSPILVNSAIVNRLAFQDNYDDGIANYLYNNDIYYYDAVVVVHETPMNSELAFLISHLNAMALKVTNGTICLS